MTTWLLTWFWQGIALAVSLSIALHLLPRVNAATRYVLWWGAFAALIFLGWQSLPAAATAVISGGAGVSSQPVLTIQVQPLPHVVLSLIGILWVSVALFRLLRIVPELNTLYRLKDDCRSFPAELEMQFPLWQEALERLKVGGRRARLALCDHLSGAAVLGLHEPCIAMPSSLVNELSAGDLDQIILHEYGHIQRRDDWMRLLQALLEAAVWMHPATLLIGRELNLEREVACDDWVVARTGSPKNYARCLSRVAEQQRSRVTSAFAQALFGGKRDLFRRVDRLLDTRRNVRREASFPAAAIGAVVIGVCAVQLAAFPILSDGEVQVSADMSGAVTESAVRPDADIPNDSHENIAQVTADATFRLDRKPGRTVHLKTDTTDDASTEGAKPMASPSAVTAVTEDASEHAQTLVIEPSKAFQGVYQTADPEQRPVAGQMTPWQAAGNAGVGIGVATKRAGVGLASTFTKAGTAIARSF